MVKNTDERLNVFSRTKALVFVVVSIDFIERLKKRYQTNCLCVSYNYYKISNQNDKNNQPIDIFIYQPTRKNISINI